MPIKPENKARYPKDWPQIRERILDRAGHRCEWCKVPNYAVGHRDAAGNFVPNAGNLPCDASGHGKHPNGEPLTYAEAREFADHYNGWCDGLWPNGERAVVIVLTIAHIEPVVENCADWNLAALCQRCHNRHDAEMRKANAAETRRRKLAQHQPALLGEATR